MVCSCIVLKCTKCTASHFGMLVCYRIVICLNNAVDYCMLLMSNWFFKVALVELAMDKAIYVGFLALEDCKNLSTMCFSVCWFLGQRYLCCLWKHEGLSSSTYWTMPGTMYYHRWHQHMLFKELVYQNWHLMCDGLMVSQRCGINSDACNVWINCLTPCELASLQQC